MLAGPPKRVAFPLEPVLGARSRCTRWASCMNDFLGHSASRAAVSAVDAGHVPLVVALAGGRREVIQPYDLLGAQLDAVGGGVLLDARHPLGAWNRRDVVALREQPGQRDLGRCGSRLGGDRSTSSTMRRLRWKFSPVKRGLVLRQSSSGMSSASGSRR